MSKIVKVEIEDSLQDLKDNASNEIVEEFIEFLKANPDVDDWDSVQEALQERDHEIADSNTPIYYSEIDGLYYLHGDELEESYKNHGFGNGNEDNHRAVTIYCVILDAVYETMSEIQELFEEWTDNDSDDKMTREQFIEHVKSEVSK